MEHSFWGNIKCDGNGKTEILLQVGSDGMVADEELLLAYASTYVNFLNTIGSRLFILKQRMFEVYMEYLKQDDDEIDTIEQHNEYIKDLAFIRIGPDDLVELCFYYALLNAPVHSVTFIGDKLYAIYDQP